MPYENAITWRTRRGIGNKKTRKRRAIKVLLGVMANPLQIGEGGRAGAAGKKIKVHSNPEVIYGVLDFRARVRPALMNTIDSILLETARKDRRAGRGGREKERERSGKGEERG